MPTEILTGQRALFARMRREAAEGHVRVGWKIGHAIEEVDALGAGLPAVGWISTRTVLADGDTYPPGNARALRGETEVAIELARAIDPAESDDAVRAAIAGVRVALEIVDVARPPFDPRGIIEGNVFHRAVVFGARLAAPTAARGEATLVVGGRVHREEERPPHLISVVRDVARLLAATGGESLAPGELILSGSLVHVPVTPGDELCAEIEGLGAVRARIGR